MFRLLLLACTLALLGCPQPAAKRGSTARPASGGGSSPLTNAALIPQESPSTVLPGQGPHDERDDLPASTVTSLPAGESFSAQLEAPDDRDRYALGASAGDVLRVAVHGYGEVVLRLRAPGGEVLAEGSKRLEHLAARDGVYVLEVSAGAGQGLFYTLVRD